MYSYSLYLLAFINDSPQKVIDLAYHEIICYILWINPNLAYYISQEGQVILKSLQHAHFSKQILQVFP